ncbi:hypothetical protein [Panacagrimonas perspica]|nr:hypothetical protein [Panacagrimonas perspica]
MTDAPPPAAPEKAPPKSMNSFRLLGVILAGVIGIRRTSDRGGGVSNASTGAILGAVLIFAAVAMLGMYAFVNAVKSAAGN